ncbi:PEP-CTERM sorting domain-containing protein [Verrucomicrobiaceae bacterium R5-34]|nr:PEP-CTERM sorting domain-containing protein [Verrucomicrobiaceae bacterium R5-34]
MKKYLLLTSMALPLVMVGSVHAATTVVYSAEIEIGPSGTLFSDAGNRDNWTGDDIENWQTQSQSDLVYLRNHNRGDDTIKRDNDANFSYNLAGVTSFSMQIDARVDSFWEAGLAPSAGGAQLLIGGDYNNSDDFYINFNGTRYGNDNNLASTVNGNAASLRLDYDVITGTADLIYDPGGVNESALITDLGLNISATQLQNMDQLSTRANTQYAGAGTWTITTVPEPSSMALLGLGGLALMVRRRK